TERFFLPFVPFLLIWCSKGIEELFQWSRVSVMQIESRNFRIAKPVGCAVAFGFALSLLIISCIGIQSVGDLEQGGPDNAPMKEAGLWLNRYKSGPKRIMDTGDVILFYADGFWVPYPYADSSLTLRYIDRKKPDFLVVRTGAVKQRPFLQDWIERGIP